MGFGLLVGVGDWVRVGGVVDGFRAWRGTEILFGCWGCWVGPLFAC